MTDVGGRAGRMPELGARVETLTRYWKGPQRKAAIEYAIAKASRGAVSKESHKRIADLLEIAINREAGGSAVPPAANRAETELGNISPMVAFQNAVPEISKLGADADEKFAVEALRIFFKVPRVLKKMAPGTAFKETHEQAFRALKTLLSNIPAGSLPSQKEFGSGGLLNRYPRGVVHRTVDLARLSPEIVAHFATFFGALPPSVINPQTQGNFYHQLAAYDGGRRVKKVIGELQKRSDALSTGRSIASAASAVAGEEASQQLMNRFDTMETAELERIIMSDRELAKLSVEEIDRLQAALDRKQGGGGQAS